MYADIKIYSLSNVALCLKYLSIAQLTFNIKACTGTKTNNHWHFSDILQISLHMKGSMSVYSASRACVTRNHDLTL